MVQCDQMITAIEMNEFKEESTKFQIRSKEKGLVIEKQQKKVSSLSREVFQYKVFLSNIKKLKYTMERY